MQAVVCQALVAGNETKIWMKYQEYSLRVSTQLIIEDLKHDVYSTKRKAEAMPKYWGWTGQE